MPFAVLKHWDPMVGCDFHDQLPPPVGPPIVPRMPHVTLATLGFLPGPWGWSPCTKQSKSVFSLHGDVMGKGTDIGPGVVHIQANYLLPIIILTSGSKSHFGPASVTTNIDGSEVSVGAAVLVYVNLNLNCGGASKCPPTPTGVVIACNTVLVGMTLGDIVAGIAQFALDFLVQWGLNCLFSSDTASKFFNWVQGPIIRAICPGARSMLAALLLKNANPYLAAFGSNALPTLAAVFGLGSPVGYSPGYTPVGGSNRPWQVGSITNAIATGTGNAAQGAYNYFASPSVPQYGGTPAPVPAT